MQVEPSATTFPAPDPRRAPSRWLYSLTIGAVSVGVAWLLYGAGGHDDSHITYWAAHALAEFGEIVNYNGDRVEQSSSLLHTIVLSILHKLTGWRFATLGWLLGVGCLMVTVLRAPWVLPRSHAERWPEVSALVGTAPLLLYWSTAGLESTLYAWLLIEVVIAGQAWLESQELLNPAELLPLVGMSLLAGMTRPEAFVVLLCGWLGATVTLFPQHRRLAAKCAMGLVMTGALLFALVYWRLHYFGAPFPQPVTAKMGAEANELKLVPGIRYFLGFFARVDASVLLVGLVAALVAALRAMWEKESTPFVLAPMFSVASLAFAIAVGGDWMIGSRFFVHAIPLMVSCLVSVIPFARLETWRRGALIAGLVAANLVGLVLFSMTSSRGLPVWARWQQRPAIEAAVGEVEYSFSEYANMPHARDMMLIDDLDRLVSEVIEVEGRATLLSLQAGMVMKEITQRHYGEVEFFDRGGLVTRQYNEVAREFNISTRRLGLDWTQREYFQVRRARTNKRYFRPHIIFDIYGAAEREVKKNGYVIVYKQTGKLRTHLRERPECPEDPLPPPVEETTHQRRKREVIERIERRTENKPDHLWKSSKSNYQFIALRKDVARKLGYLPRLRDGKPVEAATRAQKHEPFDKLIEEHAWYSEGERLSCDDP